MTRLWLDDIWRCDKEFHGMTGEKTLSDVLSRLKHAHQVCKMMKGMSDAFHFFSRTGAPITTHSFESSITKLHPEFIKNMPTVSGVFFGNKEEINERGYIPLSAAFMCKYSAPVNVQLSNGTYYHVVCLHRYLGKIFPVDFWVSVSPDGSVKPLKSLSPKAYKTGSPTDQIHRLEWGMDALKDIAADNDTTIEDVATKLAALASHGIPEPGSFLVRAMKHRTPVSFRIHPRASARFFADRDVRDKKNNKIFHYRRGHYRRDGRFVRPCYPGSQRFTWNGFDVRVFVPKTELYTFDAGAIDARDPSAKGGLDVESVVQKLSRILEAQK